MVTHHPKKVTIAELLGAHIFHNKWAPKIHLSMWFQMSFFSPLTGEDSHFDEYFSNGLKPPTSLPSLKLTYFPKIWPGPNRKGGSSSKHPFFQGRAVKLRGCKHGSEPPTMIVLRWSKPPGNENSELEWNGTPLHGLINNWDFKPNGFCEIGTRTSHIAWLF